MKNICCCFLELNMQTHPTGVQNEEKELILHRNRCKWPCFVSFLIIFLLALFACSMMGEAVCTLGRHNVSVSSGSAILISPFPVFFFFVICLAVILLNRNQIGSLERCFCPSVLLLMFFSVSLCCSHPALFFFSSCSHSPLSP